MAARAHALDAVLPRSAGNAAFARRAEVDRLADLRRDGRRCDLLDAAAARGDRAYRSVGAQALRLLGHCGRGSLHRAARFRARWQGGAVPGRARSEDAGWAGVAARLAPQARSRALAALSALAYARREAAAQARRAGRARHRDLADLHRGADGLSHPAP